jgi:hypothetical protein
MPNYCWFMTGVKYIAYGRKNARLTRMGIAMTPVFFIALAKKTMRQKPDCAEICEHR